MTLCKPRTKGSSCSTTRRCAKYVCYWEKRLKSSCPPHVSPRTGKRAGVYISDHARTGTVRHRPQTRPPSPHPKFLCEGPVIPKHTWWTEPYLLCRILELRYLTDWTTFCFPVITLANNGWVIFVACFPSRNRKGKKIAVYKTNLNFRFSTSLRKPRTCTSYLHVCPDIYLYTYYHFRYSSGPAHNVTNTVWVVVYIEPLFRVNSYEVTHQRIYRRHSRYIAHRYASALLHTHTFTLVRYFIDKPYVGALLHKKLIFLYLFKKWQ